MLFLVRVKIYVLRPCAVLLESSLAKEPICLLNSEYFQGEIQVEKDSLVQLVQLLPATSDFHSF